MEEEMEEGHFDKEGMYIFKKDKVGVKNGNSIMALRFQPIRSRHRR